MKTKKIIKKVKKTNRRIKIKSIAKKLLTVLNTNKYFYGDDVDAEWD